jgi:predicted O-methyltransferase YrrM
VKGSLGVSDVRKLVEKVDGWLTDSEGELLYRLAKDCNKGVIVEIGSWKGKSTIWLSAGSKAGNKVKVYAVDPHTGSEEHKEAYGKVWTFEEFKKNIKNAGMDDIVIPLVKESVPAAAEFKEPVGLIFVDGAHDYESVKKDFKAWYPKVADGGIMVFHDTFFDGPKRVVEESVFKSGNFRKAGFVGITTFAEKVAANTRADRARNKLTLLVKNSCQRLSGLNLPKPVRTASKKVLASLFGLKGALGKK